MVVLSILIVTVVVILAYKVNRRYDDQLRIERQRRKDERLKERLTRELTAEADLVRELAKPKSKVRVYTQNETYDTEYFSPYIVYTDYDAFYCIVSSATCARNFIPESRFSVTVNNVTIPFHEIKKFEIIMENQNEDTKI